MTTYDPPGDLRGWRVEDGTSTRPMRPVGTVRQRRLGGEWLVEWPDGRTGWYERGDLILISPPGEPEPEVTLKITVVIKHGQPKFIPGTAAFDLPPGTYEGVLTEVRDDG